MGNEEIQEAAEELLNEKNIKKAMVDARKQLPSLDVRCYDSDGRFKGTVGYSNRDADLAKKCKLFEEVKNYLKECKEATKFEAWLGTAPGKGKQIKFGPKGLTGKSSLLKLFSSALGGPSALNKLADEQAGAKGKVISDFHEGKITQTEASMKLGAIMNQKTVVCIKVVG